MQEGRHREHRRGGAGGEACNGDYIYKAGLSWIITWCLTPPLKQQVQPRSHAHTRVASIINSETDERLRREARERREEGERRGRGRGERGYQHGSSWTAAH